MQSELEKTTRVCAYDRAGLGWSEASDRPFRLQVVPAELHTLLDGAGEHRPYLFVGDGLGAAFATEFAAQFPDDTAALVLLDSPGIAQLSSGEASTPFFPVAVAGTNGSAPVSRDYSQVDAPCYPARPLARFAPSGCAPTT